jgi:hypothetical protein
VTVPAGPNTQIVGQGLARLTSAFITKPNIRKLLAVYLQPWQDLEIATWGVMNGRFLSSAPMYSGTVSIPGTDNSVFDVIGKLVGVARSGLGDYSYRSIIYLEIAVNRATGRTSDWAKFFTILEPFCSGTVIYLDGEAAFYYGLWDLTLDPNQIGAALIKAVPNGIGGEFVYTTWPDGNDFEWSSIYDAAAGQGKWGSIYDATVGGLWVAEIGLNPNPINASWLWPR